jgi:hypothetical protein
MSEILARIRVRETAGIRRFLYPLQAKILVPNGINPSAFGMTDQDGQPVPNQIAPIYLGNDVWSQEYTLDFAVSLEPFAEREFIVAANTRYKSLPRRNTQYAAFNRDFLSN